MRTLWRCLFVSTLVFSVAPLAHAQLDTPNSIDGVQVLVIKPSPEYPKPYEAFFVTPNSTLINLSEARLTYYINGKQIAQTTGKTSVPVQMGPPGKVLHIVVTAEANGSFYQEELDMYPQDAVLVVEPLSTIPPFYRGAALLPAKTVARVTAVPDFRTYAGVSVSAASLSYEWSVGVRQLEEQSGIGRSVLTIEGPEQYRGTKISVLISSRDQPYVAYAETKLDPIQPTLRVYRNDALLGPLFVPSIGSKFTMKGAEQSLMVVPYFFKSTPTFSWNVSGADGGQGDTITVRSSGTGGGVAALSVEATGEGIFSLSNFSTRITFGDNKGASSFFDI